ncbi:MAG: hypothetical protein KKB79_01700 [Nanoarchaeota archaeon]|nr:hypothetical protein [Nanoarchaeota archaeon]
MEKTTEQEQFDKREKMLKEMGIEEAFKKLLGAIKEKIQELLEEQQPASIVKLREIMLREFPYEGKGHEKVGYGLKGRRQAGVYIIYEGGENKENIIYVGEADSLIRRLLGDIGKGRVTIGEKNGEKTITLFHSLCRKIEKENKFLNSERGDRKKIEEKIREEIEKDYLFSYITTSDKSLAFAMERTLIEYLEKKGVILINKSGIKKNNETKKTLE